MGRPKKSKTEAAEAPQEKEAAPKSTGTAVSTRRAAAIAVAPQSEPANLMVAIARAAADPAVNVEKMVALHNLHKDIVANEARMAFDAAFADMQVELPIITKRGRIEIYAKSDPDHLKGPIQSTPFATWDDIGRVIKPILARHGFALWFKNDRDGEHVITTAILTHKGGHREETTVRVPLDTSGSKNNAQGVGSSTSYGKRYAGGSILNLIFEGEDDDAQSTAPTPEERKAARSQRTDGRLGNLADKTAPKKGEPEHDEDGVIREDQKPAGKATDGTKRGTGGKAAAKASQSADGAEAGGEREKNAPKSPDPRPDDADFEVFRAYIAEGLKKCENPAQLTAFWKRDVEGWGPTNQSFLPPDFDDLKRMFGDRKEELAGGGKK